MRRSGPRTPVTPSIDAPLGPGLEKTLINAGGMTVAFLVLGLVLIALGRLLGAVTGPRAAAPG